MLNQADCYSSRVCVSKINQYFARLYVLINLFHINFDNIKREL